MVDPRFYELINRLWQNGKYGYYWGPKINGEKLTFWITIDPLNAPIVPKMFDNTDCYFGVNPSNVRRSQYERARALDGDIAIMNALYFDIDYSDEQGRLEALARIKASPIQPACLINSGGGFHGYALLRETNHMPAQADKDRGTALQRAFITFMGGDDGAKDLARVLRVPGTTNYKPEYAPNYPTVTIEQWDMSIEYDLADIEKHLQPIIDAAAIRVAHTPTPQATMGAVSLSDTELLAVLFKSKNGVVYQELWAGNLSAANGDHSKADQMLANGLAWLTGRDIYRMDSLFRQSGLMRDKWADRQAYRENTLNNAAGSAQTVYDPQHNGAIDPVAVAAAQAAVGMNGSNGGSQLPPHNNGNSNGSGQPSKGLTTAQQATIDFLFAAGEWDLLAAICAKIPVKLGRPYLKSKFLAMHNGDAALAADELKSYHFAGTLLSERVEADLTKWGYSFAENELDGTIYRNGQALDEAMRAEINLLGRDNNYGGKGQPALGILPETILVMGRRNRYHPVRDWLNNLVWDGRAHLTNLLAFFKDKHTPIVYPGGSTMSVFGAFLMRWMQGAIERAYGNKDAQNPVLVLAGSQGLGKSYFPKWLCSSIPDLFVEGAIDPENPDHKRLLVTRFIWEISELPSTMNRTDANGLKSFLTTGEATFRVPYAKDSITRPALASFIGTLNPTTGHLIDVTGNRRFLSVELESIDQAYSGLINVEQLWAEAVHYYRQSVGYRLSKVEEEAQNNLNIASRMTNDTTEALLKYYDIDPLQTGWFEYTIDIVEHLREKQHRTDVTKVGTELRGMLGYGSAERQILSRRGKGFYGIQKK